MPSHFMSYAPTKRSNCTVPVQQHTWMPSRLLRLRNRLAVMQFILGTGFLARMPISPDAALRQELSLLGHGPNCWNYSEIKYALATWLPNALCRCWPGPKDQVALLK